MNKSGLQLTDGQIALSEIEKLKERVENLEQRYGESSPLEGIVSGTLDKQGDVLEFEPISEERLGLIEGCLKDEEYSKLHTETIKRLIKTCKHLYGEYMLSKHQKIREVLIKEGLAFPETIEELELFEKYH